MEIAILHLRRLKPGLVLLEVKYKCLVAKEHTEADNIGPISAITGALIEKCALESKKSILAIRFEGVKCSL